MRAVSKLGPLVLVVAGAYLIWQLMTLLCQVPGSY